MVNILDPDPTALGSIPSNPEKIKEEKMSMLLRLLGGKWTVA